MGQLLACLGPAGGHLRGPGRARSQGGLLRVYGAAVLRYLNMVDIGLFLRHRGPSPARLGARGADPCLGPPQAGGARLEMLRGPCLGPAGPGCAHA